MTAARSLLLLLLASCTAQLPEFDPGGNPALVLARVEAAQSAEIRGVCFSACALKLSAAKVCVSPAAVIGVHEVRRAPQGYENGTRDPRWTAFFRQRLPECARALFDGLHGFDSGRLAAVTGAEILAACPQIETCR